MQRFKAVFLLLSITLCIVNSYSEKVTGNVLNEDSTPVCSARVELVNQVMTTTTDSVGYFEFDNITPIWHTPLIRNENNIRIKNGKIGFTLLSAQKVLVELFDLKGRCISKVKNEVLDKGTHAITLFDNIVSHSIYIVTIHIGNASYSLKANSINSTQWKLFHNSPFNPTATTFGPRVIDTLAASKDGYENLSAPIDSYDDNYVLTLKKLVSGRIVIIVSVDWEGRDLENSNLTKFKQFRDNYPNVPLLQFLNAAYYTKPGANTTDVTSKINSVLLPIDEHGLHIHGWKTLFEEAGVVHHRFPGWWYGDTLSDYDCSFDCGHEIAISDYTKDELCKVIQFSQDKHTAQGFEKATSFRTGGWMGRTNVLEALVEKGFQYDHSSSPTHLITGPGEIPENTLLVGWLKDMWKDITITSQPYEIISDLIEVPDNGCLADYMTGNDMLDVFKENVKLYKNDTSRVYYVSIGFHQETAYNYIARVADAIDLITEYAGQENVPVEFRTRPYSWY